ncbi:MAG TPA: glycerophosphoryl diester phosphodiesterase membrane domain-containing protein, partial [Solirubrobacteraceae bacterium]|nr:glycerophosphoryl diester phosphodiesterase membrane domain-containing protein [Solirubrobacteraceae bacterium]
MTTPQAVRPRLRPLSVGEILDVAIKICLAHWRTLIKAVLVVVVPVQVVSTLLTADYTVDSFDFGASSAQTSEESLEELNQYLGGLAISGVLQICAVLLATAACFRAIAQAYLGERTDWRSSLAYALRLAPALLVLTLLYVGGVALGTIALLAPGVWLAIAWAFALPALLVEDVRGARALGRSFRLVKGRWWRTFGVILVGFVLATVVSTVVQAVFFVGIFADADNDVLVLVLSAIAGIVGLAITTPFQAALVTVVYFDLRVRKEGFDLELLAQGIGERAPAAGAGAQSGPAPAPVLPPQEQVDRSAAPFWPPPPGWRPSGG